jgi:glutamate-ammonia-ligase adenylyltransferase
MRIARHVILERLAVLDVEAGASLGDITRAMTELAEATLELALAQTLADQDARFGVPRRRCRRADRLLDRRHGKARRAQSSTCRPTSTSSTSTSPTGQTDGRESRSAAHEYFSQVARGLYALIGDVTEDGFVFRVDLALRPNGNSGPPVTSLAMLEEYLQAHGREWSASPG